MDAVVQETARVQAGSNTYFLRRFTSTAINCACYDKRSHDLSIMFSSGNAQAFHKVPVDIWHLWIAAVDKGESAGKFYNEYIGNGDYDSDVIPLPENLPRLKAGQRSTEGSTGNHDVDLLSLLTRSLEARGVSV